MDSDPRGENAPGENDKGWSKQFFSSNWSLVKPFLFNTEYLKNEPFLSQSDIFDPPSEEFTWGRYYKKLFTDVILRIFVIS